MKKKYIYFFGNGSADGNANMKDLLGGKGANLAEMANLGLQGYLLSTNINKISDYRFDVFLSYADQDIGFARMVGEKLRTAGFKIWLAEEQLVPGKSFREGLQQGLTESQHLCAILSKHYVNRQWTQREIDMFDISASQAKRRVIAIEIDKVPNPLLDQVFLVNQRITWRTKTFDFAAFWKLNCGLKDLRPEQRKYWRKKGRDLLCSKQAEYDSETRAL